MTESPAKITAEYLRTEGIFTDPADGDTWPLYVSALPDGEAVKDNAAAVMGGAPRMDNRRLVDGDVHRAYGVQILLRCLGDYNAGWEKIVAAAECLEAANEETVTIDESEYTIDSYAPVSGPMSIGSEPDTPRRAMFSYNALLRLR